MKDYSKKVFTIPNIMSMFRLLLIVPMCILFFNKQYIWTVVTIAISALSDVLDGIIARKYNMISNVGKILDPVADKLTQIAIMLLLSSQQVLLLIPCGILIVKEVVSGLIGIYVEKHIDYVLQADWHGKLSTVFLYAMLSIHMIMLIINGTIQPIISLVLIIISSALITLSFILYFIRYMHLIKGIKEKEKENMNKE